MLSSSAESTGFRVLKCHSSSSALVDSAAAPADHTFTVDGRALGSGCGAARADADAAASPLTSRFSSTNARSE
jgi:hypothetical protein